ncbi:MAG TPA: hypothetical protein DCF63_09845 [Planctomycetaceae bacterium]|nr:hypothetical protein [Planctomycetaceae bacterium]
MAKAIKSATGKWKIQIQVDGRRVSRTFHTKGEADLWAAKQRMTVTPATVSNISLYDLCVRWHERYADSRKYPIRERQRIEWFKDDPLFKTKLKELSGKAVADWRDRQTTSPATVNRDWNLFSAICTTAIKEMDLLVENPFAKAKRLNEPPARKRVPTDAELQEIRKWSNDHIWNVIVFATETGMRQSDIANLHWDDVRPKSAILHKTKNGDQREVPLSKKAIEAMGERGLGSVFGLKAPQINYWWKQAVLQARVDGLRFHDLRAYACVKMSKVLQPYELAKVMGWRNLSEVMTYYRKSADDIADKLDA